MQQKLIPIALPCVDDIGVVDTVSLGGHIQEVKEPFDGRWKTGVHTENGQEQLIYVLL